MQLELLQHRFSDLVETQSIAEERSTRAKIENAVLQAKCHVLEEQLREVSRNDIVI